jgi:hypothetical protein
VIGGTICSNTIMSAQVHNFILSNISIVEWNVLMIYTISPQLNVASVERGVFWEVTLLFLTAFSISLTLENRNAWALCQLYLSMN